jgi:hypothetical protein
MVDLLEMTALVCVRLLKPPVRQLPISKTVLETGRGIGVILSSRVSKVAELTKQYFDFHLLSQVYFDVYFRYYLYIISIYVYKRTCRFHFLFIFFEAVIPFF